MLERLNLSMHLVQKLSKSLHLDNISVTHTFINNKKGEVNTIIDHVVSKCNAYKYDFSFLTQNKTQ